MLVYLDELGARQLRDSGDTIAEIVATTSIARSSLSRHVPPVRRQQSTRPPAAQESYWAYQDGVWDAARPSSRVSSCSWLVPRFPAAAQLARLLDHLRAGDTLLVWRLDRLGRPLRHLTDRGRD